MAMDPLTRRQRSILDFIAGRARERGLPPTLREIAAHFSVTVGGLQRQLQALETKGALERLKGLARGLRVAPAFLPPEGLRLPIVGRVPAGPPSEAFEEAEGRLEFGRSPFGRADYALRVRGESMSPELAEGDLVLVRRCADAADGELVVAHDAEGEATVKRLRRRGGRAWLEAVNPAFAPPRRPFRVVGKVVGLVRRYR